MTPIQLVRRWGFFAAAPSPDQRVVCTTSRVYDQAGVDAWTFIWLMVILKIPIVALFLIVRWAVRATDEPTGQDGGIGPQNGPTRPLRPIHPRARLPRSPRRGPHGDAPLLPPARVRTVVARSRFAQR